MAYFMRHIKLAVEDSGFCDKIYSQAAITVQNCYKFPGGMTPLFVFKKEKTKKTARPVSPEEFSNLNILTTVVSPTDFGAMCIARHIMVKYQNFCDLYNYSMEDKQCGGDMLVSPGIPATFEMKNGNIQLVNIGLNCLYTVLSELNERDPAICSSALGSLYSLLQSLAPDSLTSEPYSYIKKLFHLLKHLRNSSTPEISVKSSSCMLSLSVAYGSPELLLSSASIFLTTISGSYSGCNVIGIPKNYRTLVNQIYSLGAKTCNQLNFTTRRSQSPNWFSGALTKNNILFSIPIHYCYSSEIEDKLQSESSLGAIASDGTYLYTLTKTGLYKLGTGFSGSIFSKIYAHNSVIKATSDSWLSVSSGSLYLKRRHSTRIWVLDSDSLREIGEILLAATVSAQGTIFCDGSTFHMVTTDETGKLILSPVIDNFSVSSEPELKLSLTRAKYVCFGEEMPEGFCSKLSMPLSEQAVDLQVGDQVAFLLTHMGRVFYCGKGPRIGMQDTKGSWLEIPLGEPITSMSVSQDGNNIVFRSSSGQLWYAGSGCYNDHMGMGHFLQSNMKASRYPPTGRPRRIVAPNHKRIISCAAAESTVGFITENGRVFLQGRHVNHCHPESGQVLGLEQVHLGNISLGKTHVVALSRHGHVYTWGLNNLYQCGRAEPLGAAHESSDPSSSNSGFQLCPPMEHMWVKDVATLCTACGMCSAHGNYCPSKGSSPVHGSLSTCGPGESGCLRCGVCRHCGEHSSPGSLRSDNDSDQSSDRSRKMVLGPARLAIRASADVKITKVSCGNYHTLLLSNDGQVFSFGSNCHGQLGVGDTRRKMGPQHVSLSKDIQVFEVAAGANHSVLRTCNGLVYTFGSNHQGQLGRVGSGKCWHAKPGLIPSINSQLGSIATWINACGDVTLVQCEQHLLQSDLLERSCVTGNQKLLMIFMPVSGDFLNKQHYLVVERKSGRFQHFQMDLHKYSGQTKGSL